MIARVYVTLKASVLDPQGQAIARSLGRHGFAEVRDARIGKLIELDIAPKDGEARAALRERVDAMCRELLANTVIEEYRFELPGDGDGNGASASPPATTDRR